MIGVYLALAAAAAAPERDWGATLRADAQALHDDIAANHPGPVDRLNPGFGRANDEGLALALKRSRTVKDYSGYWFAMSAYVASFDDGHLGLGAKGTPPAVAYRWPGFLTGFDQQGAQTVVSRADDAPLPIGATLLSCDGRTADRLAAENVGAFVGRWKLSAQRKHWAGTLFVDQGNPFISLPSTCEFRIGGAVRKVKLAWRAIALDQLTPRLEETQRRARPPIGSRVLADGTRWYQLSSFNGDPQSDGGKQLPPLIAAMKRDLAAGAVPPPVVLDLRGNGGGSSDWSRQIAEAVWGEAAVKSADVGHSSSVDWRVSPASIATITAFRDSQRNGGHASPELLGWLDRVVAGLTEAKAKGAALWTERDEEEPAAAAAKPASAPARSAPVYVLTDSGCASACLDAVDLWLALGAVHIGEETSADTLYMDIRRAVLPSGLSQVAVPMKVYRGRPRGSNVPLVPRYAFPGDLRDSQALEQWVARLPSSAPRKSAVAATE